ncbi:MAG TPA: hypothetical protein VN519_02920 [Bryobacteraceae bacterium]|nr:hypothetical protein [Bryobacteraceae bacterium]
MAGPLYYLLPGLTCADNMRGAAEEQGKQAGAAAPQFGLEAVP